MFKCLGLCTALITFGMVLALHAQPQPPPIKRTILQRADVPGTNLEIIYATVEIAAGFKAGRHNHPEVAMGQVVEGTSGCTWMASQNKSCTPGSL